MKKESPNIQYIDKIVAFIDILGFKNLINKSEQNQEILENIVSFLTIPPTFKEENIIIGIDNIGDISTTEIKIKMFSDSLIIITENTIKGLVYLSFYARSIFKQYIKYGIFYRGGIASGKVYYDDDTIFGPAFNRAYEIESCEAYYPRIVIDKNLITSFENYITNNSKFYSKLFTQFEDENYFIHYLWHYQYMKREDVLDLFNKINNNLYEVIHNKKTKEEKKAKEIKKYLWLNGYVERTTNIVNEQIITKFN